jgi:Protein of unknown function (DUF2934)
MTAKALVLIGHITGETVIGKDTGGGRLTREAIARRAFDLYEKRGRQDGHDMDDWLLAERELRRHFQ